MAHTATVNIEKLNKSIQVPTGLFINNEFVPSVDSQERIDAINPATEEVICSVTAGSAKDIDVAVAAARAAFTNTWGKNVTGWERSRLLHKLADLMERDAQVLGELESLNNGKPVRIARQVGVDFDIGDSIQCLRYYAGWADKLAGQTLEVDNRTKLAFTRHDPIGVCGQIIPWNYPINMWAWKVAPALAVGCTIVMKPSELTPLTALKLSELVKEAGFPPGVVNTVPSLGSVGGAALASHMDVDKVAFTGSTVTGRKIMEAAAKSNLKKDCTAGSRVYAQDTVYDKFLELLVSKVKAQVIGNGLDEETGAGPVVSKGQYDRVWGYIESGKADGAHLLLGGAKRNDKGYFIDPTNNNSMADDANQCMRVSSALEAGTVWVNQYNLLYNNVPFGGKKQSGIGRELGSYALEEYTSVKAVHWNFGEKLEWPL
ncbi:hypothetical protein EST38_g540 [Candolleomyces aberdarensis]|uniref:Aldehyde dehydrogenase domain-containing protein n=1 Tax=Candolleomyces aberdarensis TaxID=2316362 RepID=A0A4Q2E097_9AGAR|nr:hypothetical protein EST38_g540 [Candolleomyces aberdarensis]